MDTAWVVTSRERVPAPVLKDAARAFLAAADEAEPFVEGIRVEARIVKNYMHLFYRDPWLYHRPENPDYSPTLWERFNQRTLFWFLPLVGSTPASTVRNLDACYQRLVVMAEKPYRSAMQADYGTFIARFQLDKPMALLFRARDPVGRVSAAVLPNLERDHRKIAHRDAMLRGMALFLAVRAYETEHGQPPETLDALVPDYLPRIPEDPFDGNPFRYLRRNVPGLPPEAWAVYSIGENFIDEGGVAHSVGTYALSYGINPDFVWPSVGYPEPEGE